MRMKRLLCTVLILSVIATICAVPVTAENIGVQLGIFLGKNYIEVKRDGHVSTIKLDTAPLSMNGTTYIPLNGILQQLGVNVDWDASKELVTITRGSSKWSLIKMGIGATTAAVNEYEIVKLAAPGKMIKGKPMLPLKFVLENIGCYGLAWDKNQNKVTVTEFIIYNFTYSEYLKEKVFQKAYNGSIYYINTSDGSKLYRKDSDGKNEILLRDVGCETIWGVNDDGIYITKRADRALYKISSDGSREELIAKSNEFFKVKQINQHQIYYIKNGEGKTSTFRQYLYVMDTRIMVAQKAMEDEIKGSLIVNNDICYFYNSTETKLYKVDLQSKSKTVLCNDAIGELKLDGDALYYSNLLESGALYKVKTDGSGSLKLSLDFARCIVFEGEYVYYVNACDGNKLYKVPRIGGQNTVVDKKDISREVALEIEGLSAMINTYSFGFSYAITSGDWIYGISIGDNSRLYRIKTNGTCLTRLTEDSINKFRLIGGAIYYTTNSSSSTGTKLFKINMDGREKKEIAAGYIDSFSFDEEWIYLHEYSKIYKIRLDGTENTNLVQGATMNMVIYEGKIYYINMSDGGKLYQVSLSDLAIKPVCDDKNVSMFGIDKGWITLYTSIRTTDASGKKLYVDNYYRMKLDGTERQQIKREEAVFVQ